MTSLAQELAEFQWLQDHPDFKMRPATIREFVGPGYLDEPKVRPGIMQALVDVFGDEVRDDTISQSRRAVITGAIGIGKTFFSSIALSYMVHWVKCLKDPQDFFELAQGTVISFMMMSTSKALAQEVTFGATKARIENSEWFKKHSPVISDRETTKMRFDGHIWIVPGTSEETSFEGHNILAGIIDEGDSHKITARKDYADAGYDTINSRIASRYTDDYTGSNKGLIICIGQMKSKSGFMARKYNQFLVDEKGVAVRMSLWESRGWYRYTTDKEDIKRGIETAPRDSFFFDQRQKRILTKEAAALIMNKDLIEVPNTYMDQFVDDPVKALRDLAGIPPEVDDPFISRTDRILEAQDAWHQETQLDESPCDEVMDLDDFEFPPYLRATDDYKRVIHIDTAYSANGDALGLAMGHIPRRVLRHSEERPVVVYDFLLRLKARSGTQIDFSQVRELIYTLRDDRGFNISLVTLDGFNTVDFIQELNRKKIRAEYLSVDKNKQPYENLRDLINDRRTEFPRLMVRLNHSDTKTTNIAYKELSELADAGRKIDHPPLGSKDVADAMAGVADVLVTQRKYAREARFTDEVVEKKEEAIAGSLEDLLGMDSSNTDNRIVSFEEFAKDSDKFMGAPSVDYGLERYNPFGPERRL